MKAKKSIIVLDDDQDIHNLIVQTFKNTNFHLTHAYSVEEAITLLKENHYTYGIFDIILSKSTTSQAVIEFLETKEAGINQYLPLCIMSSHMDEDYSRRVKRKGANVVGTLHKPFTPRELKQVFIGHNEQTILLLEDDPDISRLIKKELEQDYFSVYCVRTNERAIELIDTTQFLCAIIDNHLAENKSTAPFFNFLSTIDKSKQPPIILTGLKIDGNTPHLKNINLYDKIEKPFKKNEFSKSISQLLRIKVNVVKNEKLHIQDMASLVAESELNYETEKIQKLHKDRPFERISEIIEESQQKDDYIVISSEELIKQNKNSDSDRWHVKNIGECISEHKPPESKSTLANKRNERGLTPAMSAAEKGELQLIKKLVDDGANLSLRTKEGMSVLHYAAMGNSPELISYLIEQGFNVNDRDKHNCEPLFYAISTQKIKCVQQLIQSGARVNSRVQGKTYLTLAVLTGNLELTQMISEQNINPNLKDHKGKSSIDYARLRKRKDIYNLLNNQVSNP